MEKGIIRAYDKSSGSGTIGRAFDNDIKFVAGNIIGNDRSRLKEGDQVMFEVENRNSVHVPINIRKCL